MKYYAKIDNSDGNKLVSSFKANDDEVVEKSVYPRILIEITEEEYGTLNIPQDKINTAVNTAIAKLKDIDELNKLDKAIALANIDIFNDLRTTQGKPAITKNQYKNYVIDKYNSL
jgi:hypothetical protein